MPESGYCFGTVSGAVTRVKLHQVASVTREGTNTGNSSHEYHDPRVPPESLFNSPNLRFKRVRTHFRRIDSALGIPWQPEWPTAPNPY